MKALSRKLFRDIRTLRLQIFTMAILVTCGVAVLVASWSSYNSLQNARDEYYEKYLFADIFAEITRAPHSTLKSIQSIPGVQTAEARIVEEGLIDIPGQPEPALGRILSWSQDSLINKVYLRSGRFPENGATLEVLVHESFAKAHRLNPGEYFEMNLKGQKQKLYISGIGISPEYVYALSPVVPIPDDRHFGVLWMSRDELARLLNLEDAFNSVVVRTQAATSIPEIQERMDRVLAPYGGLGSYTREQQTSNMFVQDEIRQQKSMAAIVPGIFIFVSAFILHTVMSRLIGLHRMQIAALKAVGYSSKALAFYYWKLVSIILAMGTLPALLLAYGIGRWYAYLYAQYFRFPSIDFSLSRDSILFGLAAGLIPGWLASFSSLTRIFALNPAEAMRPPAPADFSQSFFERWRLLNPKKIQSKMIFRNILARPGRSFLSTMGIAAATAVLINGGFWTDIIDYMIERQFYQVNREDLEVQLLHPRGVEALAEVRRIQGVSMVEGGRSTAVRLHFKNMQKDTAIISSTKGASLRRILNREGKSQLVPQGQILLSLYFKDQLQLKIGDRLRFVVSAKSSPPFEATIAGFVEDVVGSVVYANKVDLHHWLNESESYNTLLLKIDPDRAAAIYVDLKNLPEVASINVKRLLYQSFMTNLSDMIQTFTLILVLFATAISGAVLFNMARINLSEKSWELASLKIIGFQTNEVFRILYLEIGICVIASFIPGILLGYFLSYLSIRWIHTQTFVYPLVVDIKTYSLGIVVIVVIYFITGIFLLNKIRSLSMTEALKARE